jgi:hypothetical protein
MRPTSENSFIQFEALMPKAEQPLDLIYYKDLISGIPVKTYLKQY